MERPTMMKTINGRVSQKPMFDDIIEPSLPYMSFPHKRTIKDASFSSYLNREEPNSQPHDSELSIFDAQKYFNETGAADSKLSKRVSPVESNVIGLDHILERCDFSFVPRFSFASSSADGYSSCRNYRTHSFHATPTASSEASWNSQIGLLTNPPGAIAVSIRNPPSVEKRRGLASKWLFRQKCPCYGRKSVQVEEKLSEPTPSRLSTRIKASLNPERQIPDRAANGVERSSRAARQWLESREAVSNSRRISAEINRFPPPSGLVHNHRVMASGRSFVDDTNGFTFPILTQASSSKKLVLNTVPPTNSNPQLQDPPRDSLEVFQPLDDPLSTKPAITGPHRRHSFTFPASPKSRMAVTEDDIASDASSDLFEIESFSTQSTSYPMYNNCRDSLDEASSFNARRQATTPPNGGGFYGCQNMDEPMTPSVAPTECYEPSEASIDWSVVTAEGCERGSTITSYSVAASEADYRTTMCHRECEKMGGGSDSEGKKRGGNGGLLSCRSEKAVSVGPQPVKCEPDEGQRGVNTALRHVSSRPPIANHYKGTTC